MELKISKNKENSFLKRKEVQGKVVFSGATPSNQQLQELAAKELSVSPDCIVIKTIQGHFGYQEASFNLVAYDSLEAKNKTEVVMPHIKKKTKQAAPQAGEKKGG